MTISPYTYPNDPHDTNSIARYVDKMDRPDAKLTYAAWLESWRDAYRNQTPYPADFVYDDLYMDALLNIAFIGDSNTQPAVVPRWHNSSWHLGRSDVEADISGTGTLTLYSNSTAKWAAFGDTAGPLTNVGVGFSWLESGTVGKGCCFNITASTVAADGLPLGNPIPIEIVSLGFMGSQNFNPCTYAQMISGQVMTITTNLGEQGVGAKNVYERINQVFTVDFYGRPTIKTPNIVSVLIGINDVLYISSGGTDYDVDDVKVWLTGINNAIINGGAVAIFGNIVLESPSVLESSLIAEINAHIASLAGTRTHIVDNYSVCNGVDGAMSAAHYTNKGSQLAGEALAAVIEDLVGSHGKSPFRFDANPHLTNLVVNGELEGTDGNPATPDVMTGEMAMLSGYGLSESESAAGLGSCVASKESIVGQHDKQVYTVTNADEGDYVTFMIPMTTPTPGTKIFAEMDLVVTGAGIVTADMIVVMEGIDPDFTELTRSTNTAVSNIIGPCDWRMRIDATVRTSCTAANFYAYIYVAAGNSVIKVQNIGAAVI